SRFEALHPSELTALVGRAEETELLLRRWSRAKSGEGQVVLISGEAGIGKSRLTAALLESLAPEPHTRLRYFCSPQHTDSAFSPSSVKWNVRRDCYTTIRPSRNSTSSTLCWRTLRPRSRTPHSLPRCSRCRTMVGIPPSS